MRLPFSLKNNYNYTHVDIDEVRLNDWAVGDTKGPIKILTLGKSWTPTGQGRSKLQFWLCGKLWFWLLEPTEVGLHFGMFRSCQDCKGKIAQKDVTYFYLKFDSHMQHTSTCTGSSSAAVMDFREMGSRITLLMLLCSFWHDINIDHFIGRHCGKEQNRNYTTWSQA